MSTIGRQQKCRRVISAGNAAAAATAGAKIFTKYNNFQNLNINTKRKCSSAQTIVTTHWSHSSDEKLIIEDLEQKRHQQQVKTLWKSTRHFSERSLNLSLSDGGDYSPQSQIYDAILAREDFTVYQDGDVSDFFGDTGKPERVSEVCLVNDHYILVKMPESYWQRKNSQIECIVEEVNETEDRIDEDHHRRHQVKKSAQEIISTEALNAQNGGDRKTTISKYFQCHRSCRISPIHEELQEAESSSTIGDELKMKTKNLVQKCWSASDGDEDHEVFVTRTKISKNLVLSKPKVKEVTVKETAKSAPTQNALDLRVKRVRIQEEEKQENSLFGSPLKVSNTTATDYQNKTNKILQTSLHDRVILEHHGSLVTPIRTIKDGESLMGPCVMPSVPHKKPKKSRHHFNAFRWLLKPFRLRSKTKKPKSKIQAVIYKTYFVRWKKPPDVLWQQCGYGVRHERHEEDTKLRRCRSATF